MKSRGYHWPDPIDPGEAVCIRVFVPADPLYIGAFFNSLGFLAKWVAWHKDGTDTAKQVAEVWKFYNDQTVALWDQQQGECGVIDVRQSPTDPCKLEAQYLPGGAWVQIADLALCKFDPGAPKYPASESWKEIDDDLWHLKSTLEQIDGWIADGLTLDEIKLLLAARAARSPGLTTLAENMFAMTPAERTAAMAAINWAEARLSVYCQNECNPFYGTDYYAWLQCISDEMFAYLNSLNNDLFDMLNTTSDWLIDGAVLSDWATASGGGGAGFGGVEPDCGWYYDFDFGDNSQGWVLSDYLPGGVYSAGAWQTTDTHHTDWRRHVFIKRSFSAPFPGTMINKVRLTYDMVKGTVDPAPQPNFVYSKITTNVDIIAVPSDQTVDGFGLTRTWEGEISRGTFSVYAQVMCSYALSEAALSGECRLKRVQIWGVGNVPIPT